MKVGTDRVHGFTIEEDAVRPTSGDLAPGSLLTTVPGMAAILDLDSLLAQLITALGLALVAGNGLAILRARRGHTPEGVEGEFRPGRAWFLLSVGIVIGLWGLASLFT